MSKISRYSPELRDRAVGMVNDNRQDYPSEWAAFTAISKLLGMRRQTLRAWVRKTQVDVGARLGITSDEMARLKELERKNEGLVSGECHIERRVDFLYRRARRSNQEVIRYIDVRKSRWRIKPICRTLQFAPSTYYAAKARPVCQ